MALISLLCRTHTHQQTRWMKTNFTYSHNTYEECLWSRFLHPIPSLTSTLYLCLLRSDVSHFKCCFYHRLLHWLNFNFEVYIIRRNILKVCSRWCSYCTAFVCWVCARVCGAKSFWRENFYLSDAVNNESILNIKEKKIACGERKRKLYCGSYIKGEVRALTRIIGVCSL